MLNFIDTFLNKITMYRLVLYYLIFLIIFSAILGFFKLSPYTPFDILLSTGVALIIAFISNSVFSKLFKTQANIESVFITALILVLITPIKFPQNLLLIIFVSFMAMFSKYFLAIKKRHIFNPAAISLVIALLVLGQGASWWISAVPLLLPAVFIGGFLVIRKTRREGLVFKFFILYFLIIFSGVFLRSQSLNDLLSVFKISILDSSLLFFAFVMLIEPLTIPTDKKLRGYYGYVVALFYATSQLGLISFVITAEMALCIGNIFAFIVNPNYRLSLILKHKRKLSEDAYEFAFNKQNNFNFIPGQYMEWTLSHKNSDSRGNRRYFSISSSPTEKEISFASKFYQPSSSFKKELLDISKGEEIIASSLAGGFTLPKSLKTPLIFIAGGVGITPFRSMIKYIIDKNLQTDIILIYANRTKEEILFHDIFKTAEKNGIRTIHFLTDERGHLNKDEMKKLVPDFQKRIFYISGPQLMVKNFENMLHAIGINKKKIKTDFFPGYDERA